LASLPIGVVSVKEAAVFLGGELGPRSEHSIPHALILPLSRPTQGLLLTDGHLAQSRESLFRFSGADGRLPRPLQLTMGINDHDPQ
jgi:hypothetical protein